MCPAARGSEKTCKITILFPKCPRVLEIAQNFEPSAFTNGSTLCLARKGTRIWGISSVRRYENFGTVHRRTFSGPACFQNFLLSKFQKPIEKQCDFRANLHVENCFYLLPGAVLLDFRGSNMTWHMPDRVRPNPDRARRGPNRERLHSHGYGNLFKPRGSQGPEGPPAPPRARRRARRAWRAKRAPSRRPPPEPRATRAGDEIRNEKIWKLYDTAQAKLGGGLAVFGEAGSR